MKRFLIYGLLFTILIQGAAYSFLDNASEVRSYLFTEEIEKAAKDIDKADPVTQAIIKKEKIKELEKELELQEQQLAEIESDFKVTFIEKFRKKRIESKIKDIETQLKELEK